MQNSILSKHSQNYLESINIHKTLVSQNLSDLEIKSLYNYKYELSEFDIYKYITAYDYIVDSLNSNITLTEGITKPKNKYNNILIDLFYHNIPHRLIQYYPISVVFGIKQKGQDIFDISNWDLYNLSLNKDINEDNSYLYGDIKA